MASRYRSRFWWVKRCQPAALAVATCALAACGSSDPRELPTACVPDLTRATRISQVIAGRGEVRELGVEESARSICFSDGPGTLHPGGVLALPREVDDAEAAARLAHLLHHRWHGRGLVAYEARGGRACDDLVEEALREEAEAHVLEMELRAALRVEAPVHVLEMQGEVLRLARGERTEAVLAFLRAHPEGGGGFPPLGRDYRERCERE